MNIKNYIIKKLGGFTSEDLKTELKNKDALHEKWVVDNLIGKDKPNILDSTLVHGKDYNGDVIIVQSRTTMSNCKADKILVAPWCTKVLIQGCRFTW